MGSIIQSGSSLKSSNAAESNRDDRRSRRSAEDRRRATTPAVRPVERSSGTFSEDGAEGTRNAGTTWQRLSLARQGVGEHMGTPRPGLPQSFFCTSSSLMRNMRRSCGRGVFFSGRVRCLIRWSDSVLSVLWRMAASLKICWPSNLIAMASNLIAMASNQIAMASKLLAMASKLLAMASELVLLSSLVMFGDQE